MSPARLNQNESVVRTGRVRDTSEYLQTESTEGLGSGMVPVFLTGNRWCHFPGGAAIEGKIKFQQIPTDIPEEQAKEKTSRPHIKMQNWHTQHCTVYTKPVWKQRQADTGPVGAECWGLLSGEEQAV